MSQTANPLRQFFRQPAIYLRLPSQGNYWTDDSINLPPNKELPVFPMTAIDEITYRTPDALFNGQAMVSVIESCVPNILNAWDMPGTDFSSLMTSIRIASYGHELTFDSTCPACTEEGEFSIDLRAVLDDLKVGDYETPLVLGDLEISFAPMTYRQQNDINQEQFERQRMLQSIQGSDATNADKITQLNAAFQQITLLTIDAIKYSISSIRTPQSLVTETEFIKDFLMHCDRKIYTTIRDHAVGLRAASEFKPMTVKCDSCGHEYKQTLTLDQVSFFDNAS